MTRRQRPQNSQSRQFGHFRGRLLAGGGQEDHHYHQYKPNFEHHNYPSSTGAGELLCQ
jgi:hypothetical protein